MDLKKFAETYVKLESKALDIMKIYGLGSYNLEGIEVEEYNKKTMLNIKTEFYYSGCGSEYETLSFEIGELENDLDYFKNKYKEDVEKKEIAKKLAKEKETKDRKIQKEAKDEADYKRLKLKFETKS